MTQSGSIIAYPEVQKLITFVGKREKFPQQWMESNTIVLIYQNGDKTDCSNQTNISLLSPTCGMLYNILVSRLSP